MTTTQWRASVLRMVVGVVAAIVMPAATAVASTLNLSTSYDGMAITDTLPNHRHVVVNVFDQATSSRSSVEGELIDGALAIDLDPGTYNIGMVVASAPLDGRTTRAPGDLYAANVGVEVPDQGTVELEYPLQYAVHITSPLDNGAPWNGTVISCPKGPEVPRSFTLAWEPVPNVTRYEVFLVRLACDLVVESLTVPATETSVELTIDPDVASSLQLQIRGFSDRGSNLVTNPRMQYDDAGSDSTVVHAVAVGSRPAQSAASLVAIQVARLPGSGDSFWTSDLTISNPTGADITATLVFTPRGANGSVDYETATVDIPAGGTRTIRDVVGSVFGLTAAGSLEVRPRTLQAWVRTSTPAVAGSYGQGYPMVAPDDPNVISLDGTPRAGAGGVVRGEARTNLGIAELWGAGTTVRVRLLDRDGAELGSTEFTLMPFENRQLNDVVRLLSGSPIELAEGRVTVEVLSGAGRVAAALSIADNGSNDPTTVPLEAY